MNPDHARRIVQNAVATTKPRWRCYDESWRDIDVIFIKRGYEQQGFRFFRFTPYLSVVRHDPLLDEGRNLDLIPDHQHDLEEARGCS